jgi:hypothetical protein
MGKKNYVKIILDTWGNYLGMEKGCIVVRNREGEKTKYPLTENLTRARMYNNFTSLEFKKAWNDIMFVWEWETVDEFIVKYGFGSEEAPKLDLVSTFFEGIGVMVKRGLIDISLVDDLMSGHVTSSWEKYKPIIEEIRKNNWPQCLEYWEYLYDEVRVIMEEQHPETAGQLIGIRST